MKECTITLINTTSGKRFLIVTAARSKEFKTLAGAERWIRKNNYKIKERNI